MRNEPKPLSIPESERQHKNADILSRANGASVRVEYVKRNGETSSSRGEVAFFNGKPGFDTGSVTIADPDKGNRTVNLHRITKITFE